MEGLPCGMITKRNVYQGTNQIRLTWTKCYKFSLKFDSLLMYSKVGIVVVLSSLHSSHRLPLPPATATAAASALLSNSLPLTSAAAARKALRWSVAAVAAAAKFAGGAASGASFAARANAVLGFWGWQFRTGQDRLLIQCRVCKASCLKVVQLSAPVTCRFELLRVRVRVRWRVPGTGARRASFSLSFYCPLPTQTLADNRASTAALRFSVQSSRCSLVSL